MSSDSRGRAGPSARLLGARPGGLVAGAHTMTALRRVAVAVGVAGVVAAVLRLRGKGGVPPEDGGWRELHPDELRSR